MDSKRGFAAPVIVIVAVLNLQITISENAATKVRTVDITYSEVK